MDVAELSVTAAVREVSESGVSDEQLAGVLKAALAEEGPADGALIKQPWVHALVAATPGCRLVFSARSNPDPQFKQHLSTGLSPDHLFLSLLQSEMLSDMLVLYVPEQRVVTLLQLGLPVCGNPTLVHGGLLSAVFDETFGVVLYATGRFGHLELTQVFTARLEVDYKKPVPAEATIICDARIESVEGRKIWLQAELRDESGSVVYASSRALFVRPRDAQAIAQPPPPPAAAE